MRFDELAACFGQGWVKDVFNLGAGREWGKCFCFDYTVWEKEF